MNSISIDTVAIHPACQHKGYGTQMLNEFFEKTHVTVYSLNAERIGNGFKLYDKVGFSDDLDKAYMIYMPGVTDKIKKLKAELKANLSEKSDNL